MLSTKSSLLVFNRDIPASSTLVLATNEIRNLLILCLLNCRLIILRSLSETILLNRIYTYSDPVPLEHDTASEGQ